MNQVTYLGGPTALIELAGLRFLTDPTFDPAGTTYPTPAYTLRKTQAPAWSVEEVGRVDAVLLSHDHHFDNLDRLGRALLDDVPVVYTTRAAAERLGRRAVGLAPWESVEVATALGAPIVLTATPARHGPAGGDRGPVIGFLLQWPRDAAGLYVSGDTVRFDGVDEVGRRFRVSTALLHMGAAKVAVAGPAPLTFTAEEAAALGAAWLATTIVPLHFEGWEHFTEGRREVEAAFAASGRAAQLAWLQPGQHLVLEQPSGC